RRLADLGRAYHLAVSLHAPDDELRTRIVPTNDKTGIKDILEAADYFFEKNGRRVTFEYVLLRDLNDRPEHARQLSGLLAGRCARNPRRRRLFNSAEVWRGSDRPDQRPAVLARPRRAPHDRRPRRRAGCLRGAGRGLPAPPH